MSQYFVNDEELTSVANAIRAKSGGSNQLIYPQGFISELDEIDTGERVYTSSNGLLYTAKMTINLSLERTNGYKIAEVMSRFGSMPYLKELTLTGICRMTSNNGTILAASAYPFVASKYPLLKKLHIEPTEIRKTDGSDASAETYYNQIKAGNYAFAQTNLIELSIGKVGGPYWVSGGYFRNKDENNTSITTIGSTDGLTLKVYVASYLNKGGFASGNVASNTTIIEYDYQTGEILTP